jgi:uncharacterized membrane protein
MARLSIAGTLFDAAVSHAKDDSDRRPLYSRYGLPLRYLPPAQHRAALPESQKKMMMIVAEFLHILGITVWVGGMFFAYMALRPIAASALQPPQRLQLWVGVFRKFFFWVWLSVLLILASGLYMMALIGKPPVYVMVMATLGIVMMLIFAHVFFAGYKRLKRAVAAADWPAGGAALGQIRMLVGVNLILGLVTIATGALGPLFLV